ncbi:MAG: gamma-glutamyltransferase [Planctomycetaceae bacterium]
MQCLVSTGRCVLLSFLILHYGVWHGGALQAEGVVRKEALCRALPGEAVVAADHPLASEAGAEVLKLGGNAVDAAVATSFALSVLRPEGCGLGGGGFMMIWDAKSQQGYALDYRERAPRAAHAKMFATTSKPAGPLPASEAGGLAVAVPGNVAGLCYAVERFGSLPLDVVLGPAIRLTQQEIPVDPQFLSAQRSMIAQFQQHPELQTRFAKLWKTYLNSGEPFAPGDHYHSPLEEVLTRIAKEGADGFYRGEVAAAIVSEIERQQGIITAEDLSTANPVVVRSPLRGTFHGYKFLTMPPPSSGGIAEIEVLNVLEAWESQQSEPQGLRRLKHNSADYVHLVTESLKHAFADRAEFLGDADVVDVPIARLTSKKYAAGLAKQVNMQSTKPLNAYGRGLPSRDAGTSHLCVIDSHGNGVACTETINTHFGSLIVEPLFGIVLNNEMDDFAARPGEPNAFGLVQSARNAVAPGKKPLSSMSPTIVLRDGKATFVVGGSGGPRIISGTLQVLLNMMVFEMTPEQAVSAPRFHHQWLPDQLLLEQELHDQLANPLKGRGHQVELGIGQSATQAAALVTLHPTAASDPRKGGRPAKVSSPTPPAKE